MEAATEESSSRTSAAGRGVEIERPIDASVVPAAPLSNPAGMDRCGRGGSAVIGIGAMRRQTETRLGGGTESGTDEAAPANPAGEDCCGREDDMGFGEIRRQTVTRFGGVATAGRGHA